VSDFVIDEPNYKGIPMEYSYAVDSTILNYRYAYNNKALMTSRSESVINRLETYEYDKLDRLTQIKFGAISPGTMQTQTFDYYDNGNIFSSHVGFYTYGSKPHAVSGIVPYGNVVISTNQCDVAYNTYNQPSNITEGVYSLDLSYRHDQQRYLAFKRKNDILESKHLYISKHYEIEMTHNFTVTKHYNYIYGDNGVVAMRIKTSSANDMYYIHTDHLGSYCAITDASKQVKQRSFFDPWGNVVSGFPVSNGSPFQHMPVALDFKLTNRGFTGHEHYPEFKIINMNGRLYDPVIARFFSPDKYVANSSFTQDFNRYTYARNNPLMYTDPDGELPVFVIPLIYIVVRGAINIAVNWSAIQEASQKGGGAGFGKAMGFFGIGAVDGAVSYFCPALAPIVGYGTSVLNTGLYNGTFKGIDYGQLAINSVISLGISTATNGLINSTFGKADFFTKTLGGNMLRNMISNNISTVSTNLFMSKINTGDTKQGWQDYLEKGWWSASLSGMNDGMKTHYQTNSKDYRQQAKNEFKEQMLKDRDFRKNLSTNMKDLGFSGFDRFQLQMHRLSLLFTNPFSLMNNKPNPILQLNHNIEPQIPTVIIPGSWETPWGH